MDDIFLNELRKTLNNLYDLKYLRTSPLCQYFGLRNPFEAPILLQKILEDAINDLKPSRDRPQTQHAREIYDLLTLRYLQQFSQREVAEQLGVSVSQMNRIQQKGLEDLAASLWLRFSDNPASAFSKPDDKVMEDELSEDTEQDEGQLSAAGSNQIAPVLDPAGDIAWIAVPSTEKTALFQEQLNEVLLMLGKVFTGYPIKAHMEPSQNPMEVLVYPEVLRQVFLLLITSTAALIVSGDLRFQFLQQSNINLLVCRAESDAGSLSSYTEDIRVNLDLVRHMVNLSGGALDIQMGSRQIVWSLRFPLRGSIPVLVVDDNRESLGLMQRLTADTRYRLIVTDDPFQAIALADQEKVQAIILDIMMPRMDGWDLLQRLNNHPATSGIPVVICSIMRQEELAWSLQARAYLRKPINQESLLQILDEITEIP